eukprot:COSAG02_NODE_1257_length_13569_cov_5.370676_5_plen_162_part_00
MVMWCHALCREQPQFEFLELPNPYTSKLWQDDQSSDGPETATTTPSAEVATPPSSAVRTKVSRDALRITAQGQKPKLATNAESIKSLLSVESAIRRAGVQVSNSRAVLATDPGLDAPSLSLTDFVPQRKPALLYDIEAWESASDAQHAATVPLSLAGRHGR